MIRMPKLPYEEVHPELKETMALSDAVLGGSEWIQYFAHTPDLYRNFKKWYYEFIMAENDGISIRLTELVRHKVAQHNQCKL
ncbi:MAG: hypothetical protein K2Y51_08320 [Gammaproteobacteria bacterium]|jgi:hypothetical protein|nr:hypothetical protein [Gammaproteobacteria bacterium]